MLQKNRVRNGELYRVVADTGGAFVQPALYEGAQSCLRLNACLHTLSSYYAQPKFASLDGPPYLLPKSPAESTPAAFGLTVIEAMTCGLPCFVTCKGGPSEIVKHKRSGMM